MNKKGQFTDLLLLVILTFTFVVICGIFIYIGQTTYTELRDASLSVSISGVNFTQITDDTIGRVNSAYQVLYWGSVLIIAGMVLGIFIGSWLTNKSPLFFIPWIIIVMIVFIISISFSNVYETIRTTTALADTFSGFTGANFIIGYLPIWVVVIGFVQAIIMFISWGIRRNETGFNVR
jgi:flagellar biosynthesis protein FliQ|tara:strand:+ start:5780 stop:6313 length:534 start_codon:yes stop_codon:yes gene_type:complete